MIAAAFILLTLLVIALAVEVTLLDRALDRIRRDLARTGRQVAAVDNELGDLRAAVNRHAFDRLGGRR